MSDPIRIGHPDVPPDDGTCGCCAGTRLATLQPVANRANLTAIATRVGDHGRFKASMLANLSSAAHPPLARLGTRADDDFSIALIDAWAAACDVLTFYQERHANEAYIGTARERFSIGELARLIGYRLHPGAAAETDLVVLMDDPPGAPPAVADLTVPAGTRVQSQPGPDETAQTFETLADLQARVAWNRLLPRLDRRILPAEGATGAWLAGLPALQPGDALLILGAERGDPESSGFDVNSGLWSFRRVTAVAPRPELDRTRISWDAPLAAVDSAGLRIYHLRDRASLFGYNAPHPHVLSHDQRDTFGYEDPGNPGSPSVISGSHDDFGDWLFEFRSDRLALDAVYKSFVRDGWVVLTRPAGSPALFRIETAEDDTEARYAISGKATRLTLDTTDPLDDFLPSYRRISVYGGSTEFAFAETPLTDWVGGGAIELAVRADGLPRGRKLILTGRRARLEVRAQSVSIEAADGALRGIAKGGRLTLRSQPLPHPDDPTLLVWALEDADGFTGTAEVPEGALLPIDAEDGTETIVEVACVDSVLATDATHSTLLLADPLENAFDRRTLVIHANVVRAAHGEDVTEILGAGDPSRPFQKFPLKQAPVTHRLAATETGVASTLTVRVDGVAWTEVPDLYRRDPTARVFRTTLADSGATVVEFGDGISGARPTPGRDNIVADYSSGLGLAGNLRAGQLNLPLDRPLGLREVYNPLPATGGDDPEAPEDARRNAALSTLTLGRVVSLTDYRDFALGFPGIAKAESRWVWQGETRRIVVTVAGPDVVSVTPGTTTYDALLSAFRRLGDPLVGLDLLSYQPAYFRLGLRVAVDPAYIADDVLAAVDAALRRAFGFDARDFAQTLAQSEIAAAAHAVAGVVAIDTDLLYRETPPQTTPTTHDLLVSQPSRLAPDGTLLPSEILTLSPLPLDKLEVMA